MTPSIAELRAETQPDWLLARPNAEHWAGRLYMRRVSPYVTRIVLATPIPANAVTAAMIPAGLLAALCITIPGVWAAVLGVLFIQLQLLLDCVDGEVARWRKTFSPLGIYLDQLGHYSPRPRSWRRSASGRTAAGTRSAAGPRWPPHLRSLPLAEIRDAPRALRARPF